MRIGAVLTELGFAASGGEAKRKIAEGAVRVEGETVSDPAQLVAPSAGQQFKISLGRKKHGIVIG